MIRDSGSMLIATSTTFVITLEKGDAVDKLRKY